ncbi:ClpXP protease specificity-enhancing factor [Orbaceae bacterium ac157xtp]
MDMNAMIPRRPYLLRAMFDWIVDNELTPYILVDATVAGVIVPSEFVQNNKIILNIAPQSVGQYSCSNDKIEFNARFGGTPHHIIVPMAAIEAIYAKENAIGMGFEKEPHYDEPPKEEPKKKPAGNPFRIV